MEHSEKCHRNLLLFLNLGIMSAMDGQTVASTYEREELEEETTVLPSIVLRIVVNDDMHL